MRFLQSTAMFIGRLLIALIFLFGAYGTLMNWDASVANMTAKGMTYEPWFLAGAVALEILGALSLILGFKTRVGAFFLIVFLIPVTAIMHDFWNADAAAVQMQQIEFFKNLAVLGGLFYVLVWGSGGCAFDRCSTAKKPEGA